MNCGPATGEHALEDEQAGQDQERREHVRVLERAGGARVEDEQSEPPNSPK